MHKEIQKQPDNKLEKKNAESQRECRGPTDVPTTYSYSNKGEKNESNFHVITTLGLPLWHSG